MAWFGARSAAIYGVEAHLFGVEVYMPPAGSARDFVTVGMPDTAVRESRERGCLQSGPFARRTTPSPMPG